MTIAQTSEQTRRKPLRLWPGVVAVVLQWLARFGLKAVVPGFQGLAWGAQGGLIGAVAVVVWWVFLSRAAWFDRLGAIVLMVAAMGATWSLKHESMGPFWVVLYAIPILCLAFVAWAVASRRLADGPRRATMVATVVLACGVWTLVRTEGITGDHVAKFAWRWTETPEEKVMAQAGDAPVAQAPAQPTSLPPAPAVWIRWRPLAQSDAVIVTPKAATSPARICVGWRCVRAARSVTPGSAPTRDALGSCAALGPPLSSQGRVALTSIGTTRGPSLVRSMRSMRYLTVTRDEGQHRGSAGV